MVKRAARVPVWPSTTRTSEIRSAGGESSSAIVPRASASWVDALWTFLSLTPNVSSGSSRVSPLTGTVMVLVCSLGAKASVPLERS
jgi:hypothetical protein